MTNDGLNTLAYDAENRLVTSSGSTYSYDGASLRVKKVSGGTTTVYVLSGTKVIAEYVNGAAPGSPTREYIYSGSALVAKIEGSTTNYYHQDHLSVRATTDSSGNLAGQQGHYPYGESWYVVSTTTKWQFTSYERDAESGNDYAMFRYHVNRLGRFSSPDLLAGSVADPQSLNRYTYVLNDPINLVDPLGLQRTPLFEVAPIPPLGVFNFMLYSVGGPEGGTFIDPAGLAAFLMFQNSGPNHSPFDRGGAQGGGPGQKKKDLINAALKQKNLSKCLNEFFGPGTILTNDNLPRIDASKDLPGGDVGHTVVDQVPETGRGTVQIDRGIFTSLPAADPFLVGTYLHETANVLAIQRFTHVQPRGARALRGARGGPPGEAQRTHPWDRDIGQQFEECLYRKD